MVYGFSEALLPRGPEWSSDVAVSGFWFTDVPAHWLAAFALSRMWLATIKPQI